MKILHIHDKLHPMGGVQAYLRLIRGALAERGHRAVMLRLQQGARAGTGGEGELVSGTSVGPFRFSRPVRDLLGLVRVVEPDVVHLHSVFTTLGPGAVDALRRQSPTVLTLHDIQPLHCWGLTDRRLRTSPVLARWVAGGRGRTSPARRLKRAALVPLRRLLLPVYRRLDRLIVANSFFRDELIRHGFGPERVRLIPLFTPLTAGGPPGGDGDPGRETVAEPVVLFVGRLSEEKGILPFIRMLNLLKGGDWRAEIVGSGPQEQEARRLASSLAIAPRTRFTGFLPPERLAGVYAACRVLVVPSLIPENFALVGLEAMAAGRPVVGFRQAGITEWLREGVDGYLVEVGDLATLASRVQSLLDRPGLADELGRNGRAIARGEFGVERHLERLLSVYDQAAARAA